MRDPKESKSAVQMLAKRLLEVTGQFPDMLIQAIERSGATEGTNFRIKIPSAYFGEFVDLLNKAYVNDWDFIDKGDQIFRIKHNYQQELIAALKKQPYQSYEQAMEAFVRMLAEAKNNASLEQLVNEVDRLSTGKKDDDFIFVPVSEAVSAENFGKLEELAKLIFDRGSSTSNVRGSSRNAKFGMDRFIGIRKKALQSLHAFLTRREKGASVDAVIEEISISQLQPQENPIVALARALVGDAGNVREIINDTKDYFESTDRRSFLIQPKNDDLLPDFLERAEQAFGKDDISEYGQSISVDGNHHYTKFIAALERIQREQEAMKKRSTNQASAGNAPQGIPSALLDIFARELVHAYKRTPSAVIALLEESAADYFGDVIKIEGISLKDLTELSRLALDIIPDPERNLEVDNGYLIIKGMGTIDRIKSALTKLHHELFPAIRGIVPKSSRENALEHRGPFAELRVLVKEREPFFDCHTPEGDQKAIGQCLNALADAIEFARARPHSKDALDKLVAAAKDLEDVLKEDLEYFQKGFYHSSPARRGEFMPAKPAFDWLNAVLPKLSETAIRQEIQKIQSPPGLQA